MIILWRRSPALAAKENLFQLTDTKRELPWWNNDKMKICDQPFLILYANFEYW